MGIGNINGIDRIPQLEPVRTDQLSQQQSNSPLKGSQSQLSGTNIENPTAQLAIESFITTSLAELGKTLNARNTLIKSLPPDIKEIVQKLFGQAATKASQPDGLAALLRQPKLTAEQLINLAVMIEQSSPAHKSAASEQKLPADIGFWKGRSLEELDNAVNLMNKLADVMTKSASSTARPVELLKSMPQELRKLVETIIANKDLAEHELPEGLATLLKESNTASDKIKVLASQLEKMAILYREAGQEGNSVAPDKELAAAVKSALQGNSQEETKQIAKVVRELAETAAKPSGITAERQDRHGVLAFTVPLYFDEGKVTYPAHIHVYHEEKESKGTQQKNVETWLRICLETENLGTVETSFRLYEGSQLDVKVRFADTSAAHEFAANAEQIKAEINELPLKLGEFIIKS